MKHFCGAVFECETDGTYRSFHLQKGVIIGEFKEYFPYGGIKIHMFVDHEKCHFAKQWNRDGYLIMNYFWSNDDDVKGEHLHLFDSFGKVILVRHKNKKGVVCETVYQKTYMKGQTKTLLVSTAIHGEPVALQSVRNIISGDSLASSVSGVNDSVANDLVQVSLNDGTSLGENISSQTLHSSTTSNATQSRSSDSLNVSSGL